MTQRHPALSASHVTGKDEMVTRMSQHGRFNRKKYETTWWIWYNMIKYQPFWVTLFFRQIHIAIVCFETAHPWTPECLCNQQMRTPTMWWENGKKVAFWKERKDFNLFTVTMVASTVSVSSLYPIVSVKKCMGTQQYEKTYQKHLSAHGSLTNWVVSCFFHLRTVSEALSYWVPRPFIRLFLLEKRADRVIWSVLLGALCTDIIRTDDIEDAAFIHLQFLEGSEKDTTVIYCVLWYKEFNTLDQNTKTKPANHLTLSSHRCQKRSTE